MCSESLTSCVRFFGPNFFDLCMFGASQNWNVWVDYQLDIRLISPALAPTQTHSQNTLYESKHTTYTELLTFSPPNISEWQHADQVKSSEGKHTDETDSSLSSCLSAGDAVKRCLVSLRYHLQSVFLFLSPSFIPKISLFFPLSPSSVSPQGVLHPISSRFISVYARPVLSFSWSLSCLLFIILF